MYGIMRPVVDKTIKGTAPLRGDLENNYINTVSSGVFYGIIGNRDLTTTEYGASLTTAPAEVTTSIENVVWWEPSSTTFVSPIKMVSFSLQRLNAFEWDVVLPEGAKFICVVNLEGSLETMPRGIYCITIKGSFGMQHACIMR